jgi:hypothetical protein
MPDFIINTPNHKRWWLPDGVHMYDSFIYGNKEHFSVIRRGRMGHSDETILRGSLDLDNPQYEDLRIAAQELANKRFRKPSIMQKNNPVRM